MSTSANQHNSRKDTSTSAAQNNTTAGFERLWVWRKAYALMLEIHEICSKLPRNERYKIRDQIERSSSSVADNIAEGHTSYYYQEKIKGFNTARKEAGETQNHIRSLQGKGYIDKTMADSLIGRYEEVIRGINGYINWVRRKKGAKK